MIGTVLLKRYELLKQLGEGGFAKTYLAADRQRDNTLCVIKHLTPARRSPKFLATARRLFEAEAAALRRLGNHEQIPALIDAFETENEFYLVQAYIDGEPLSKVFRQQLIASESTMIELLAEVLPILAFIHAQQVIHRDIKPSNLMQCRQDGKLMLIDFGAVKEIATQIHTDEADQLTVSIGTQGYAAPEQLAGRPRFSSDLYGLGMTVIHGLTGRSPADLPENPHTGELIWHPDAPDTSPGLTVFLQRLIHPSIYQRYASAEAALADLTQLDALASPPSFDMPETTLDTAPPARQWVGAAIASVVVTAIVLVIRQVGGWMPLELMIYDIWMQQQADPTADDRLLVVEVTEADLRTLNRSTPSDATLNQAIQTLQTHQPRVIGLDLHRELPQGNDNAALASHAALLKTLEAENIIAIQTIGANPSEAIPAPSTVTADRIGFNDFPVDDDGWIRRSLLFAAEEDSAASAVLYAFALRIALAYLEPANILPVEHSEDPESLDLNGTVFRRLRRHFGGYRHVEDKGYQIMLRYRSASAIQRLTLTDLLEGQFDPALVRDRAILIGTTAPSGKDLFYTPLSRATQTDFLMAGVVLHAQATSQILTSALEGQPLIGAFPEAVEVLWILIGSASGTLLGWTLRRPWLLGLGFVSGIAVFIITPAALFIANGWLPLLPATVAFTGSLIAVSLTRKNPPKGTSLSHAATVLMPSLSSNQS